MDEKVREIEKKLIRADRRYQYGPWMHLVTPSDYEDADDDIEYLLSHISILETELEDALHLRDIHRESAQCFEKKLRELREGVEKHRHSKQVFNLLGGSRIEIYRTVEESIKRDEELYALFIEGDKP